MTRPIVWALGTLASIVISATVASGRIAETFGLSAPPPKASAQGVRSLVLSADLMGHYVVHPSVGGRRVRMLVDTGASMVALSYEDAQAAGISVASRDFSRQVATANGNVAVAPVRIPEIRVGEIVVRNVDAVVLPPGRLGTSLLGMSFLKRLSGFEISQGRLTLKG